MKVVTEQTVKTGGFLAVSIADLLHMRSWSMLPAARPRRLDKSTGDETGQGRLIRAAQVICRNGIR